MLCNAEDHRRNSRFSHCSSLSHRFLVNLASTQSRYWWEFPQLTRDHPSEITKLGSRHWLGGRGTFREKPGRKSMRIPHELAGHVPSHEKYGGNLQKQRPSHKRESGDPMTEDELTMLDFAVRWAPFGGGDEHILPEFGICPHVFYRRLQRLLARNADLNHSVRRRLDELCTVKLITTSRRKPSKPPRSGLTTRSSTIL